ncbi:MAG: hypothetical protein CR985_00870 [Flavobacteriales bacterium]|nr:MAG: hypothetical protein CR985_00870 [Flavobacteriales bacterium]
MKINTIFYSLITLFIVVILSSCDPIVDEQHLVNTTDSAGVELKATQSTPGGNLIELQMVTPGITGYWDYNIGRSYSDKAKFVYPIPGTSTFTYTGTLGGEFFEKTIDVQIDVLDTPLDQDWYDLVSDDTSTGKTWVFNGGPDADGGKWWYMTDPNNWEGLWWNAAGDCCPPFDAAGTMKFDLNGSANFTYKSGPDADPVIGSFVLDVTNQILKIKDANILGAVDCGANPSGEYKIISLTEDEMILFISNGGCDTGWVWVFKPQQ